MFNDDVVDTLNDLIETSKNTELGFNECAKRAQSSELRSVFNQHATEAHTNASELQALVARLGGKPEDSGTTAGAMHRGWTAFKNAITGHSDLTLLEECERGEDAALASYRKALKEENLPGPVLDVIQRQMQNVQRTHDQIKSMRDAAKIGS